MAALLAKAMAIAVISYSPCPQFDVATSCAIRPNLVFVSPVLYEGGPLASRFIQRTQLNHELGHLIDYNFLTDSDRGMFLGLMRMKRPWVDPPNSPHEQFAEAVRLCARSTRWPSSDGGYHYWPTVFQHRKVCRWLARDAGSVVILESPKI